MTEEEFYRLGELTRAAIVEEIDSRIGRVIAVAEHVNELDGRTLTLADRLTKITAALVEADGALSQRIDGLENFAASFAPGNGYEDTRKALEGVLPPGSVIEYVGPPRKRRGLLRRKSTK